MTAQLQSELDALYRALARGVQTVSHDGRSVTYSSADDLLKRIRAIEARIGGRPKAGLASFSRGVR